MLVQLLRDIEGELADKGFVLGGNPFSPELIPQSKVDTSKSIRRARNSANASERAASEIPDPLPEPSIQYVIFPSSSRLDPILRDRGGTGPIQIDTSVRIQIMALMDQSTKMEVLYRLIEKEEDVVSIINKRRIADTRFDSISRQITNEYIRSDITFTVKHIMLQRGS